MQSGARSSYREVKLLESHNDRLQELRKRTGKSRNTLIREALQGFFEKFRIADGNRELESQIMEEPSCEDMESYSQTILRQ